MTVLLLGSDGMLGSQVARELSSHEIKFFKTNRIGGNSNSIKYEFGISDLYSILSEVSDLRYVINCIGAIPQRNKNIHSFRINWELPSLLDKLSREINFKVIQIATDCVYDGKRGFYSEVDSPNSIDAYGKSKLLGEIPGPNFMHLRCSIIGNDRESKSLYSWLLSHANRSQVNGYTNHNWNGITTLAFSRIAAGIILNDSFSTGTHHVVPSTWVSKYQLLKLIARAENRLDLEIIPFEDNVSVDRTLTTINEDMNSALWKTGGYDSVPSIEELVSEFGLLNYEMSRQI